jgi:Holliday junction resolvase-like predicted endonuclease
MPLKNWDQRQSTEDRSRECENTSYKKGLWGEDCVVEYLLKKNFEFIQKRKKIFGVEIDLLFKKDEIFYFVEVKCLGEHSSLEGRWPRRQKQRFLRIATVLAESSTLDCRFMFAVVRADKSVEVFSIEEILT